MAGQFIGVNGVARKVKNQFIGVGGVARKVKNGFIGISGVARKCFSGEATVSFFRIYVEDGTVDGENIGDEENCYYTDDDTGFYVTYTGNYSEVEFWVKGRIEAVLSDGSSCPIDQLFANGYAKSSVRCNFHMKAVSEMLYGDDNRIGSCSGTVMGSNIGYRNWTHLTPSSTCEVSVANPTNSRFNISVNIQTDGNNKQKELILSGSIVVDGVTYDLEGGW